MVTTRVTLVGYYGSDRDGSPLWLIVMDDPWLIGPTNNMHKMPSISVHYDPDTLEVKRVYMLKKKRKFGRRRHRQWQDVIHYAVSYSKLVGREGYCDFEIDLPENLKP